MEALSKQPVIIVVEVDQFCYRLSTNRAAQKDEFLLGTFRSLDSSSGIAVILGDPNLIDDSVFDVHDVLLSLLQGEVSLKMSVVVKSISDLFSEALPDESSEDEV